MRPTEMAGRPAPADGVATPRPPELAPLIDRVATLLDAGRVRQALDALAAARSGSPWATNATAVCLLRLGQPDRAVDLLRGLVLGSGGVCLRDEAPTVFKVNFATALLAAGNLSGGVSILGDIRDQAHPAVQKLRAALRRWRAGLSWWQKVGWALGSEPSTPLTLDEPLGEL